MSGSWFGIQLDGFDEQLRRPQSATIVLVDGRALVRRLAVQVWTPLCLHLATCRDYHLRYTGSIPIAVYVHRSPVAALELTFCDIQCAEQYVVVP